MAGLAGWTRRRGALVACTVLWLAGCGVGLGVAAAAIAGAAVSRLFSLEGVAARDPRLLAAVAAIAILTAAVATLIPTLRAINIDPARALRASD